MDARQELFSAFRDVRPLPSAWEPDTSLAFWTHLTLDKTDTIVTAIRFPMSGAQMMGRIHFGALPRTIRTLDLGLHLFHGSDDVLGNLPPQLEVFEAQAHASSSERFSGCIDFGKLPKTLKQLNLSANDFASIVNFEQAPPGLEILRLSGNAKLSGNFGFRQLGAACPNLEELNIAGCNFSGTAGIQDLPQSVTVLDISNNQFSGLMPAKRQGIPMFNIAGNKFEGGGGKCLLQ